ncbi:hypothetical protein H6P81_014622 [Aristolochia fimbriata]|uniref:NAB domain-containing protein n=1 Tax=Aristolochia fimbriata TaxID=158543 RepID=A0AAV7E634_ARIFI|nr:hypothetical protein H6P81_014622 [Aristolochia fimbriata]
MYYQKRPELVAHVEDFYRRYRALAERYDNVTGELRKNVPRQLQSQGSGSGSDFGSESPSPSPSPDRTSRTGQAHRTAGFDVFLGSEHSRKGSDRSSSSSDTESDSSEPTLKDQFSSPGENGNHFELQERISMLESELFDTKEKLQACEEGRKVVENGSHEAANIKFSKLEDALIKSNEKTRVLEEEIARLKLELDQNQSPGLSSGFDFKTDSFDKEDNKLVESADLEFELNRGRQLEGQIAALKTEVSNRERTIEELKAELSSTRTRFLQEKLQMELEISGLSESREAELSLERKRVSDLQEEIVKLNAVISEHESMIVDLKTRISEAYERYSEEKHQLAGETSTWKESHSSLKSRFMLLEAELNQLKGANLVKESQIERLSTECGLKDKRMEEVNKEYDAHKLRYDTMVAEKNELFAKMQSLEDVVISRDDRIRQMDEHLHRLHMEHMQLIKGCEDAKAAAAELSGRVKELEEEVERQRVVIADNAELKREAIRQLCISLEHYRDGYEKLKQALHGHRPPSVLAS